MLDRMTVLIVEDGDEYRDNLERFVVGPRYLQAHTGGDALAVLERDAVDLIYLDMRFDRIAREALLGDHATAAKDHNGDVGRAWRFLQNHQGLFILDALDRAGFGDLPVILAYDFSREGRRFHHLQAQHPRLVWVSDAVTPDDIRCLMADLTRRD
jgi:CheY-like chemotaxis protein